MWSPPSTAQNPLLSAGKGRTPWPASLVPSQLACLPLQDSPRPPPHPHACHFHTRILSPFPKCAWHSHLRFCECRSLALNHRLVACTWQTLLSPQDPTQMSHFSCVPRAGLAAPTSVALQTSSRFSVAFYFCLCPIDSRDLLQKEPYSSLYHLGLGQRLALCRPSVNVCWIKAHIQIRSRSHLNGKMALCGWNFLGSFCIHSPENSLGRIFLYCFNVKQSSLILKLLRTWAIGSRCPIHMLCDHVA